MKKSLVTLFAAFAAGAVASAAETSAAGSPGSIRLVTLDPGHFHASLVQKVMYPQVDPAVHVYAPAGDDLQEHLKRIAAYNARPENPTHWQEIVYTGPDFFQKMLQEKAGNVLVLAGNNRQKTEYILAGVQAGMNVLGDKPMAIDPDHFRQLEQAFATAHQNHVLLYDIMTERSEITTILQKEFAHLPEVFGELQPGTPDNPGVSMESIHYFYKFVSGSALKRPAWSFDVNQQGEAIADVANHLLDLVQWECFPGQAIDYHRDIQVDSARHWPTKISREQFQVVTGLADFPDYLAKDVHDGVLDEYSNGEINYRIKGVYARVIARWDYRAPAGGDSHFSQLRGTKATLVIRQGKDEAYKPTLYIEPVAGVKAAAFGRTLERALATIQAKYPGVELKPLGGKWQVVVPAKYDVGHEAHFGQVMERFLGYLASGQLPAWEEPGMVAKYYTSTTALELARKADKR